VNFVPRPFGLTSKRERSFPLFRSTPQYEERGKQDMLQAKMIFPGLA
jgi:hypothetical protein